MTDDQIFLTFALTIQIPFLLALRLFIELFLIKFQTLQLKERFLKEFLNFSLFIFIINALYVAGFIYLAIEVFPLEWPTKSNSINIAGGFILTQILLFWLADLIFISGKHSHPRNSDW